MKIGFYSTMTALPWGGSEVLWASAAEHLLDEGHEVIINFSYWETPSKHLAKLEAKGAEIHYRRKPISANDRRARKLRMRLGQSLTDPDQEWIRSQQPDLWVITIGYHLDWSDDLEIIQKSGIPYIINLQVAHNQSYPEDSLWLKLKDLYSGAKYRCFLCEENRTIMQKLLQPSMKPYKIVDNPTKVSHTQTIIPFPESTPHSLACIGRIQFASKGQDLLVEALAQPFWRNTDILITFYGEDQGNTEQLKAAIAARNLEKHFSFGGYVNSPQEIYQKHAGLILSSRFEGLPMVTIEAMRMGRIPIVTHCGRNPDLINSGTNGYLIPDLQAASVNDTLMQAWENRSQWKTMGEAAHESIRNTYSVDPTKDFVSLIKNQLH